MENDTFKRTVAHPPIQEAFVLLRFNKPLGESKKEKYTQVFYKKSNEITSDHPMKECFRVFKINNSQKELFLGDEIIIYREGEKYKSVEDMIINFREIMSESDFEKDIKNVHEVRFRVVNKFIVSVAELGKEIKIFPFVKMNHEALFSYATSLIKLKSEYRGAFADIRTVISSANENEMEGDSLDYVLDIDTFIKDEYLVDFVSLKESIKRLSEFKNDIFFSNVTDASERFANEKSSTGF